MPTIVTHPAVALAAAPWFRRIPRSFLLLGVISIAVTFRVACLFLLIVIASHGILDAMTDGGKGIGFFIPFSRQRFFLPFRPILPCLVMLHWVG